MFDDLVGDFIFGKLLIFEIAFAIDIGRKRSHGVVCLIVVVRVNDSRVVGIGWKYCTFKVVFWM